MARGAGLNVEGAMAAVHAHSFQKLIDADVDLAEDLEAGGTPHFFINGRRLVGAQPFEKFQELIDETMANARALVARGTPAAGVYSEIAKTAKGPTAPEKRVVADASGPVPSKGGATAKVVIQEFADFQCPFCQRAESTLSDVLTAYGNRVKITWRNLPLPFHSEAVFAAEAAMEAFQQKGADGFWKMHDLLLEQQGKPGGLGQAELENCAKQVGLDMTAFHLALVDRVHLARIESDKKAAADAQITGTPTFLINGYVLTGAQPLSKFKKLIERALAETK